LPTPSPTASLRLKRRTATRTFLVRLRSPGVKPGVVFRWSLRDPIYGMTDAFTWWFGPPLM
ncbi:MAG: hypothetical protein ACREF9_09265, partial [Opitutaceae bacterium]